MTRVFFVSFLVLSFSLSFSQSNRKGIPYIDNYSIEEYSPGDFRASPQNWEVYQDRSGIVYFGNTDGMLIYDGSTWRMKFLPNRSAVRAIEKEKNNIYVGGEGEFGKFFPDDQGKLQYQSYLPKLPDTLNRIRNVWQIHIYKDKVIFRSHNKLFIFKNDQLKDIIKTPNQFFFGFEHKEKLYFFEAGRGMTCLTNGKTELVPDGDFYKYYTPRAVFTWNEDSLLLASPIDGLTFYDGKKFSHWNVPISDYLVENRLYCGKQLDHNHFALGTQNAGMAIMNREGKVEQIINKETGLQNNLVLDMMEDMNGDLWLALTNGISFIKLNSPFSYYTEKYGIPRQNYYVSKHQGNLYFSNDEGVYTKPWDDINANFRVNKAKLLEGSKGQSWLFKKVGDYLLCGHNNGVLVINDHQVKKILPVPSNVWDIINDPFKGNFYIACSTEGVYYIEHTGRDVQLRYKLKGFEEDIAYSVFDSMGRLWVSNEIDGVYRLTLNKERDTVLNVRQYTISDGLPAKEGNWVFRFKDEIVFTNPNHPGIYKYASHVDSILPFKRLNNSFQIEGPVTLIRQDPRGNYWIRDNGLVKLIKRDKENLPIIRKPFHKFYKRNFERVSFIDSVNTFFGTDEYVVNYNSDFYISENEMYNAVVRKVVDMQGDSVLFYGNVKNTDSSMFYGRKSNPLVLSHKQNALRFEFSALFFDDPSKISYKAWLEGYEEKPKGWSGEANKEYTNLREGNYVFHVKAKNVYNDTSQEAVYQFTVQPPWYRSILAYVGYVILALLIIHVGVRLYVRKLKADKEKLERIVNERTSEINQQKEEIKSQAHELERINKELQKLSLVASKTDNAVMIADKNGRINWVNDGFVRLFGFRLSDLKSKKLDALKYITPTENLPELIKKAWEDKASVVYESSIITRQNADLKIQTTLTPIYSEVDEIYYFIAIATDITQLKTTQQKLQKLVATKDKFFSIIAHDLKNPFHSLMGISELLVKNSKRYSPDKLQELHQHLYKVAYQGYQLLNNLLDWARAQTGKLDFKFESVKLYDLIDESFDLVSSSSEKKQISLENFVDSTLLIRADRNTIKTVIRNLISNAVKYTSQNGFVKVYTQNRNNEVEIFVEDNGVGISPENLEKLFRIDMNYSTKGTDEEQGTGLGLVLCKEFVEKNGGELNVNSVLGEGSRFSFTVKRI